MHDHASCCADGHVHAIIMVTSSSNGSCEGNLPPKTQLHLGLFIYSETCSPATYLYGLHILYSLHDMQLQAYVQLHSSF